MDDCPNRYQRDPYCNGGRGPNPRDDYDPYDYSDVEERNYGGGTRGGHDPRERDPRSDPRLDPRLPMRRREPDRIGARNIPRQSRRGFEVEHVPFYGYGGPLEYMRGSEHHGRFPEHDERLGPDGRLPRIGGRSGPGGRPSMIGRPSGHRATCHIHGVGSDSESDSGRYDTRARPPGRQERDRHGSHEREPSESSDLTNLTHIS